ncbi:MAG: prepilin-type N-terminal cleavage/methylation domain-containing protein, partial [Candidatus Omnitrophica bacterium]|nr:prepilin-type N-terminal cleavage/methylation domain-containing protein [Candidatus Omnitrophota bacterium]
MQKKALTFLEILIVVVIVAIMSTLATLFGLQVVEGSKARICATNIKVVKNALDLYMLDHDFAPQSLTQLHPGYIGRAQAGLRQRNDGPAAQALRTAQEIVGPALAYAEPLLYILAKYEYG